ncbi:MAG TPA: acyl-CoA thioesterase [Myxococcota bacterium]|nr:acyl-CoA thioesterase [Myxococcota bacterium]
MPEISALPGTVAHTHVEMTQVVMPQSTNILGTVFGGQILSWIDICAAVSAQRHCRSNVVTASFDEVHFVTPIKLGYVVILQSQVNAVFHSSMEIGTIVNAENPRTGERKLAVRAFCTFVSLDEEGNAQACPAILAESQAEKNREQAALRRRQLRLKHRQELQHMA